jgi:hypothetical protein
MFNATRPTGRTSSSQATSSSAVGGSVWAPHGPSRNFCENSESPACSGEEFSSLSCGTRVNHGLSVFTVPGFYSVS